MGAWLMKSEPDVFGIADLAERGTTGWDGIRNYQARNYLRDNCKLGDLVIFYHSNAEPSGAAGLARVVGEAVPDPTQFDPADDHFDPKSNPEAPAWLQVELAFVEQWTEVVALSEIKADAALEGIEVARRGTRLSVHPVSDAHLARLVALGRSKGVARTTPEAP